MSNVIFHYYWGYRNWYSFLDGRTYKGDENLVFILRCLYPISINAIHDIIDDIIDDGIVPNGGFRHDSTLDQLSIWDMAWSFKLCPCVEMYYPNARNIPDNLTWRVIE